MEQLFNDIKEWLLQYPFIYYNLKFVGVLLLAYIGYIITKWILLVIVRQVVKKTKTEFDDILLNEKFLRRLADITPVLIVYNFAHLIPSAESLIQVITKILIIILILLAISSAFSSLNDVYEKSSKYRDKPIKGYLQIIMIILSVIGIAAVFGIITGQSPWSILTGIGAMTAIIILIFQDTILSFVASIQISFYDLVRKGDWIEAPKYGADGDVIDVSLNVIKIQNWDKTISVVPTHKLIDGSFKNWRGMQLAGGRRIKRAIYIDLSSVKFCTEEMLKKYKRFQLIKDYIEKKEDEVKEFNKGQHADMQELVNGRRLTNLGTFRAYLKAYLKQRSDVHQGLTFLVRHLDPGENGLPIEVYVFAKTIEWGKYEDIQADIFDHILAVVPHFDLRVFQYPSGSDLQKLSSNKSGYI
ncbi:MAG: mechanosensitive ion channel family protein [Ignavibacteria bacterium]|nr:mechanosensitive ion channel family protein [Ignavibacteria bacterium]MBT8380760.1 mechanosensitive ion channel family protein [Ignavibacteria bacterium]MBT8390277.1 mechanosensitive ion channel family protein [Ignavibacteria bacterium]NNJ53209.1 mechanosensitive ion channel [Ignavibacteriaceae bacterium]NNL22318.1 mechanosensitive ion channel [Ignavibacteriaceae bacterium]